MRMWEERNQLEKKVEKRAVTIRQAQQLGPYNEKAVDVLCSLVTTQERERNRILMLTDLINDISDGIGEYRHVKLMEVHEELSSDDDQSMIMMVVYWGYILVVLLYVYVE